MPKVVVRRQITSAEAGLALDNPLATVDSISGVVVHDVGQGDAISILDGGGRVALRVDYGGRESNPFPAKPESKRIAAIDARLAVASGGMVMLTHWDEDHWCSARPGAGVLSSAAWLTPRQWTSPRAVKRSAEIANIRCVPERLVGTVLVFEARNGDAVWWEKLQPFNPGAKDEDCNTTGIAVSVVRAATRQVVFLPGDAPFHLVGHYGLHAAEGRRMRGVVAFHHGSAEHWNRATGDFLDDWADPTIEQTVVFSCGNPNAYAHPREAGYKTRLAHAAFRRTGDGRDAGEEVRIDF